MVKVLGGGMKFSANDQKLPSNGTESILTRMAAWSGLSICMPEFMISGDLSKTNFTSTRAGYQLWDGYRDEARDRVATDAYQKAVALFHERAQAIPGFFTEELMEVLRGPVSDDHYPPTPRYKLHWKERPSISPLVEARAKQIELATGTKTHAQLSTGSDVLTDWECEAELYGITLGEYQKLKLIANHSIKAEDLAALLNEEKPSCRKPTQVRPVDIDIHGANSRPLA